MKSIFNAIKRRLIVMRIHAMDRKYSELNEMLSYCEKAIERSRAETMAERRKTLYKRNQLVSQLCNLE